MLLSQNISPDNIFVCLDKECKIQPKFLTEMKQLHAHQKCRTLSLEDIQYKIEKYPNITNEDQFYHQMENKIQQIIQEFQKKLAILVQNHKQQLMEYQSFVQSYKLISKAIFEQNIENIMQLDSQIQIFFDKNIQITLENYQKVNDQLYTDLENCQKHIQNFSHLLKPFNLVETTDSSVNTDTVYEEKKESPQNTSPKNPPIHKSQLLTNYNPFQPQDFLLHQQKRGHQHPHRRGPY